MPQVIISAHALADLARVKAFLEAKDQDAARRAAKTILAAVSTLAQHPERGKDASWIGDSIRELIIDFGNSGYVAAYRIEDTGVIILAFKHQKEAGY